MLAVPCDSGRGTRSSSVELFQRNGAARFVGGLRCICMSGRSSRLPLEAFGLSRWKNGESITEVLESHLFIIRIRWLPPLPPMEKNHKIQSFADHIVTH